MTFLPMPKFCDACLVDPDPRGPSACHDCRALSDSVDVDLSGLFGIPEDPGLIIIHEKKYDTISLASTKSFEDAFISGLALLITEGKRAEAIDMLFNTIDEALIAGRFEESQAILKAAASRVTELPTSFYLSLLTITKPYREHHLEERKLLTKAMAETMGQRPA